jgi:hypothetical protein
MVADVRGNSAIPLTPSDRGAVMLKTTLQEKRPKRIFLSGVFGPFGVDDAHTDLEAVLAVFSSAGLSPFSPAIGRRQLHRKKREGFILSVQNSCIHNCAWPDARRHSQNALSCLIRGATQYNDSGKRLSQENHYTIL